MVLKSVERKIQYSREVFDYYRGGCGISKKPVVRRAQGVCRQSCGCALQFAPCAQNRMVQLVHAMKGCGG